MLFVNCIHIIIIVYFSTRLQIYYVHGLISLNYWDINQHSLIELNCYSYWCIRWFLTKGLFSYIAAAGNELFICNRIIRTERACYTRSGFGSEFISKVLRRIFYSPIRYYSCCELFCYEFIPFWIVMGTCIIYKLIYLPFDSLKCFVLYLLYVSYNVVSNGSNKCCNMYTF